MSDDAREQNEDLTRAYRACFGSPAGQAVLADLAPFCRAMETCAVPGDHDKTLLLLGRNEVFLRIQQFAHLAPDEILALRRTRIRIQQSIGEDS